MKIIFLVTWFFTVNNIIPCPQPTPHADEYGRVYQSHVFTLECWDTTISHHEREFELLKDAEAFVKLGEEKCGRRDGDSTIMSYGNSGLFGCDLSDFKITKIERSIINKQRGNSE